MTQPLLKNRQDAADVLGDLHKKTFQECRRRGLKYVKVAKVGPGPR